MALDVVSFITEFLRINCNLVQCGNYPSELEALFYLLFFPTVLVILFVYVLSRIVTEKLIGDHKGIRLLIAIAAYVYIVLQGWFSFFVSLTKVYFPFLIIILGGFWFFVRHFFGGGGRKEGEFRAPGIMGTIGNRIKSDVTEDITRQLGMMRYDEKLLYKAKHGKQLTEAERRDLNVLLGGDSSAHNIEDAIKRLRKEEKKTEKEI